MRLSIWFAAAMTIAAFAAGPAVAQDAAAPAPCGLGMVSRPVTPIHRVVAAPAGQLRISFVGHATFLLETPEGVSLATDWNGHNVPRITPDIVTMNNFHITHYTDFPDPAIKYVLRGWKPGGIARHDLKLKDLRVYSVPTNIQTFGAQKVNGNSIFVFDTVNLCLAHLSHLHHDLTREEASRLGRIDVLFVPIDGYVSMSHDEVMSVIEMIKPRLVIVMHWDLFGGPRAFMARVQGIYPVKVHESNVYTLSRETLPANTEVMLMKQGP